MTEKGSREVAWSGAFGPVRPGSTTPTAEGDAYLRAKATEVEEALRARKRPAQIDTDAAWCLHHLLKAVAPSRLFVALALPEDVTANLTRAIARTQSTAPTARWSSPSTFHVTLAFLGEVTHARVPEVLGAVVEVALRHRPVELVGAGAGTFGKPPRTLWAGVGGDVAALRAVHCDLHEALAAHGVAAASHPFVPHVTLANAADTQKGDSALARSAASLKGSDFGGFRADRVLVCRSEPHGFQVIATVPLGGPVERGASKVSSPLPSMVVEAIRAAGDPRLGLAAVADVVRTLQARGVFQHGVSLRDVHRELLAAHDAGTIELRPVAVGDLPHPGDADLLPKGARGTVLAYAVVRDDRGRSAADADDEAVRAGLRDLAAREPPGSLLSVRDLRGRVALDQARFDAAVLRLFRAGEIDLHHHDFPANLPDAERNKLVRDERGTYYVGVALRPGRERHAAPTLEERVRAAYLRITGGKVNQTITLAKLRAELRGEDRERVDQALRDLQRSGEARLYPMDDPRRRTLADNVAAMTVGGERRDLFCLADHTSHGPTLEERIRAAYFRVTGGERRKQISLADLRAELPGEPRQAVDDALIAMQQRGDVVLYPADDPQRLSPADHEAALQVAGERRDDVAFRW